MGIVMIKTYIKGQESRVIYVHMSESYVRKGTRVRQGDAIGLTGNRFNFKPNGAGEPHLHLEVRSDYSGEAALGRVSCQPEGCISPETIKSKTLDPEVLSPIVLKCGQAHGNLEFTKQGKVSFNGVDLGAWGPRESVCPDWSKKIKSEWNEWQCATVRQYPVSPLNKYALVVTHDCDKGGQGGSIIDLINNRVVAKKIIPADGYPLVSSDIYWSPNERQAVIPIQPYENDIEALNLVSLVTGNVSQKKVRLPLQSECEAVEFKRVVWWDSDDSFVSEVDIYSRFKDWAPESCKGLSDSVRLLRTEYLKYDFNGERFALIGGVQSPSVETKYLTPYNAVAIPVAVMVAIKASDMCYHWGGEVGDQTPERNRQIEAGVARDCPDAKRKATAAYRLFPTNQQLSLALLKLNDVGYFNLSDSEKRRLCSQGAPLLSGGFNEFDQDVFKTLCPQSVNQEGVIAFGPGIPDFQTTALTSVTPRYGPGSKFNSVGFEIAKGERTSVETVKYGWCMINSAEYMWVDCTALAPPPGGWKDVPGPLPPRGD